MSHILILKMFEFLYGQIKIKESTDPKKSVDFGFEYEFEAIYPNHNHKLIKFGCRTLVWTHARFVKIYFDSSGSTVQVGLRSKNSQKMTILNFELSWYFRTWVSICRTATKMCTNMCSIKWDPTRPGPMWNLWAMIRKPNVRLSKMTVNKMKIGQKSFFGAIFVFLGKSDTENSNFAKILTSGLTGDK
jgi:hypothetical protein